MRCKAVSQTVNTYFFSYSCLIFCVGKYLLFAKPPPVLFCKGYFKNEKNIAIVGTRKASKFAKSTVDWVTKIFASKGFGIVSGLAVGIDSMAHLAAINYEAYTIAILPNSIDYIYPKENYKLANDILESGGCILSELPVGINRGKRAFVERNRLQTAISEYVVPIEMGI
jgi:DNA processing protein